MLMLIDEFIKQRTVEQRIFGSVPGFIDINIAPEVVYHKVIDQKGRGSILVPILLVFFAIST